MLGLNMVTWGIPTQSPLFPWDIWAGWVMSSGVCDSRRMSCGQREAQCPSLSVSASPHHCKNNVAIYCPAVMYGAAFLITLPHSGCFSLPFLFCLHQSKRPEDWEESIFVRHKECGYRLRESIHFHMYISTSPCGDGRLNSPYEISTDRKNPRPLLLLLSSHWRKIRPFQYMHDTFPFNVSTHFLYHLILSVTLSGLKGDHFLCRYTKSQRSAFISPCSVKKSASFSCHTPSLASFSHAVLTRWHFIAYPLKINCIFI